MKLFFIAEAVALQSQDPIAESSYVDSIFNALNPNNLNHKYFDNNSVFTRIAKEYPDVFHAKNLIKTSGSRKKELIPLLTQDLQQV